MADPIQADNSRYRPANYQEFRTFEEGERLLWDYCSKCRLKKDCEINKELRHAMGENFPYFHEEFVRLELKSRDATFIDEDDEGLPEVIIACKQFKSKQLEFAFMKNQSA